MTDTPNTPAAPSQRTSVVRRLLLWGVPVLVLCGVGVMYLQGGRVMETDNAYVKADKVPISTDVPGKVASVHVANNAPVHAGDLLFTIDPAPYSVAVAKAEAKLAQVRTDLAALQASYRSQQSQIALAGTKLAFAIKEQQRLGDLVAKHFVSGTQFDAATQAADLARQQVAAMEQDLARIAVTLGGSVTAPIERHPLYLAAKAELDQAQLNLSHTAVHALQDGVVNNPPQLGQFVQTGAMVMALVRNDIWVEANFTETDLTYMHPGQPATVTIDTYPNQTWQAEVDSLSPATGAEFSLIPAQNATGNWVKIAQRVPVRIKINAREGQPPLRVGLSAVVQVNTGHRRSLLGWSL